jgi:hypothetical protein
MHTEQNQSFFRREVGYRRSQQFRHAPSRPEKIYPEISSEVGRSEAPAKLDDYPGGTLLSELIFTGVRLDRCAIGLQWRKQDVVTVLQNRRRAFKIPRMNQDVEIPAGLN